MQNKISDILEIVLITYNRLPHLKNTLEALFSENSPIKKYNLTLTILDNASTDGSSDLCGEYAAKYPNIKHIRRHKNIGGNANIARAFEIAQKEYVWIICDDDFYDWSAWEETENAVKSNLYDAVLTLKKSIKTDTDYPKIAKELTFLPAAIYKTSNITDGVLHNVYANVPNMFPHLAVACALINKGKKFYLPSKDLIPQRGGDTTPVKVLYLRGYDETYKPDSVRNMFWGLGYINSIQLIEDKKMRDNILNNTSSSGFFTFIFSRFSRPNKRDYNGDDRNFYTVWTCLNFWQKIQFLFASTIANILYFYVYPLQLIKRIK